MAYDDSLTTLVWSVEQVPTVLNAVRMVYSAYLDRVLSALAEAHRQVDALEARLEQIGDWQWDAGNGKLPSLRGLRAWVEHVEKTYPQGVMLPRWWSLTAMLLTEIDEKAKPRFLDEHAVNTAISCLTAIRARGALPSGGEQPGNYAHVCQAADELSRMRAEPAVAIGERELEVLSELRRWVVDRYASENAGFPEDHVVVRADKILSRLWHCFPPKNAELVEDRKPPLEPGAYVVAAKVGQKTDLLIREWDGERWTNRHGVPLVGEDYRIIQKVDFDKAEAPR